MKAPLRLQPKFTTNTPIRFGAFRLVKLGLEVDGTPTLEDYRAALDCAGYLSDHAPWWLADLLAWPTNHARANLRAQFEAAQEASGLAFNTVRDYKYVAENVRPAVRRDDCSFGVHREVAPLKPIKQRQYLEKAATEGWTVRELRQAIRADRRRTVLEGQAQLAGMYRVLYADPPWPVSHGGLKLPAMSVEELCRLPVAEHALLNAVLFLWVPPGILLEAPGPREVISAWGFKPRSGLVWDQVLCQGGTYVSLRHEHLIIATRGSCVPDRPVYLPDSVVTERRDPEESRPASFRLLIERLYDGPRVELFASARVEGWHTFGADARLWAEQAAVSA